MRLLALELSVQSSRLVFLFSRESFKRILGQDTFHAFLHIKDVNEYFSSLKLSISSWDILPNRCPPELSECFLSVLTNGKLSTHLPSFFKVVRIV